jgi:hypothetical protein
MDLLASNMRAVKVHWFVKDMGEVAVAYIKSIIMQFSDHENNELSQPR